MDKTVPGPRKSHYICTVSRWIKRDPERLKDLPTDLTNDKTWTQISWFLPSMDWPWKGREQALPCEALFVCYHSAAILIQFYGEEIRTWSVQPVSGSATYGACVHRRCTVTERQRFQTWHDRGAWWAVVHGVTKSRTRLHFHFHFSLLCTGEGNATHSSVLAWRIPGTGEPGGLPSTGSHRVGHDWSDLAAAAAAAAWPCTILWRLGKGTTSLSFIKSEPRLFTSQCLCRDQARCCESCT